MPALQPGQPRAHMASGSYCHSTPQTCQHSHIPPVPCRGYPLIPGSVPVSARRLVSIGLRQIPFVSTPSTRSDAPHGTQLGLDVAPRFSHRALLKGWYGIGQRSVAEHAPSHLVVALEPVNVEKPYTEELEGVSTVMKSASPTPGISPWFCGGAIWEASWAPRLTSMAPMFCWPASAPSFPASPRWLSRCNIPSLEPEALVGNHQCPLHCIKQHNMVR